MSSVTKNSEFMVSEIVSHYELTLLLRIVD